MSEVPVVHLIEVSVLCVRYSVYTYYLHVHQIFKLNLFSNEKNTNKTTCIKNGLITVTIHIIL